MRRSFIALSPEESLSEAEQLMRMSRMRALPVADEGALVGVVTQRQILRTLLARWLEREAGPDGLRQWLRATPVSAAMQRAGTTVTPEMPLAETARRLVEAGAGFVAVVEDGPRARLVGLVTEGDLLRAAFEPDWAAPRGGAPPEAERPD